MKKKRIIFLILILLTVISVFAFDTRLEIVEYTIDSDKISNEIRFAVVCDLHSCKYGERQMELISKIDLYKPDALLLVGDIFDDLLPDDNAKVFLDSVAGKYKTYYVSGNHEWRREDTDEIFEYLKDVGIIALRGDFDKLAVSGERVGIFGVDDPDISTNEQDAMWKRHLANIEMYASEENFSILLSHRPEFAEEYKKYSFDLIVSGHAHGGQWRLPPFINGFFAPGQGVFPKYSSGAYEVGESQLIVSRGLARESTKIPRIFNRPELTFITVK